MRYRAGNLRADLLWSCRLADKASPGFRCALVDVAFLRILLKYIQQLAMIRCFRGLRAPEPSPDGHIPDPRIFPCDWPGPPQKDHVLDNLRIQAGRTDLTPPPETPKLLAFRLWREDYERNPIPCKWAPNHVIPIPSTPEPPPFMMGALSLKQQRASSIALQVFFKHCFAGDYSCRFRPQAGDNTTCECSFPLQDHTGPLDGETQPTIKSDWDNGSPSNSESHSPDAVDRDPGFAHLMREFLDPNTPQSHSNSPPPYQPLHAGARR